MRAATQGLPLFNRYVHDSYKIVLELPARWAEELASMAWVPELYIPRKLSLPWPKLPPRGTLHVMALHLATISVETSNWNSRAMHH